MSAASTTRPGLDRRYTAIQFALGLMGVSMPLVNIFLPIRILDGGLLMPTLASKILFVGAGLLIASSAYERSRKHRIASPLTVWSTVVGAVVLYPLGTIAFIYWLGWVRKREKTANASALASGEEGRASPS